MGFYKTIGVVLIWFCEYLSCDNLMSNKQQFFVFHDSFEASYQSVIEEIVCKNLELGTAHVTHMPLQHSAIDIQTPGMGFVYL